MKHAILITAHNNAPVVRLAMSLMDDERFTFFLLVDRKSPFEDGEFIPPLQKARCRVLPRIEINWAGYSQIRAEFNLMEAALADGRYDYLHFLQNADLPMKTPDGIDAVFSAHAGREFLDFQPYNDEFAKYKVLCRHFLVDRPSYRHRKSMHYLSHILAKIQYVFVDKSKKYYHGSALFSISRAFAEYVVSNRSAVEKEYRYSMAGDEVFLHTLLMNSPFRDKINPEGAARLIDWERREGNSPHTFTTEDTERLLRAIGDPSIVFARKFTAETDPEIIRTVAKVLRNEEEKR